jgi:hypothetical protein
MEKDSKDDANLFTILGAHEVFLNPYHVSSRNPIYIMRFETLDPMGLFLETSNIFSLLKWA